MQDETPNPAPESEFDSAPTPPTSATAPATAAVGPRWLRYVGLFKRPGCRLRYLPTRWGWVAIVLLAAGGAFSFMEYSMEPDFCRSCHLMEPYYKAWHESTHKNVACIECHFEPGLANTIEGKWKASTQLAKTLTGTYGSKPHAEVRDASCLRSGCHERRILEGRVEWTVRSTAGHPVTIHFDHKPHLTELRRGKQLRCVSCHSQIVQGKHIVVTLDSCFLCHFKGFEHGRHDETMGGCISCHDSPKTTIRMATGDFVHEKYVQRKVACENCHSDSVSGNGDVLRQVCWTCHNQPDQIARFDESSFIHQEHVTKHKVECTNCHSRILHNLTAAVPTSPEGKATAAHAGMNSAQLLNNTGGCAQCHGGLHNGALLLYSGTGGRGVEDMPSPMYRAQVDCIACHRKPEQTGLVAEFAGQSFLTTQASCDYCHANEYPGRLDEWKQALQLKLTEAETAVKKADAALAKAGVTPAQQLELKRLLDDAHHNYELVKQGRGVHNVTYATALLNNSIENSQKVLSTLPTLSRAEPAR
jgi:nitrate/TMAO reductase-like tetraheme cytochrome c subunit